jgi:hypothetical protein
MSWISFFSGITFGIWLTLLGMMAMAHFDIDNDQSVEVVDSSDSSGYAWGYYGEGWCWQERGDGVWVGPCNK